MNFKTRQPSSVTTGDLLCPAASWWRVEQWPRVRTTARESIYVGNSPTVSVVSSRLRNFPSENFSNGDVHMYRAYICMEGGDIHESHDFVESESLRILCRSPFTDRPDITNDQETKKRAYRRREFFFIEYAERFIEF